jgi:hypothetical protein
MIDGMRKNKKERTAVIMVQKIAGIADSQAGLPIIVRTNLRHTLINDTGAEMLGLIGLRPDQASVLLATLNGRYRIRKRSNPTLPYSIVPSLRLLYSSTSAQSKMDLACLIGPPKTPAMFSIFNRQMDQ